MPARTRPAPTRTERAPAGPTLPLRVSLIGLLGGFIVVAGREVAATLGIGAGGSGDSYDLFAVSLTGVVGGVFALALGSAAASADPPKRFAAMYSLVYATVGAIAMIVCLVRLGAATPLLRSLAATFLGTAVAAASAFFGITVPEDSPA